MYGRPWLVCGNITDANRCGNRVSLPPRVSSRRATLLGACIALLATRAGFAREVGRIYRLGFVVQPPKQKLAAMFDELRRQGFSEGDKLFIEPHGFSVPVERIEEIAGDIVKARPDVIYGGGSAAGRALKRATAMIPL